VLQRVNGLGVLSDLFGQAGCPSHASCGILPVSWRWQTIDTSCASAVSSAVVLAVQLSASTVML
jgi:hypothetical protein